MHAEKTKLKNIFSKFSGLLSGALIAFEVLLLLVLVLTRMMGDVPSAFGYSAFLIASPSMSPYLKTGDLIISKEYAEGDSLEVGDIITYNGSEGELSGKRITHEIIALKEAEDGSLLITTKGRANPAADPEITEADVVAVMVHKAVVLGFVYRLISTVPGFLILFVAPTVSLVIDEIRNIKKLLKE